MSKLDDIRERNTEWIMLMDTCDGGRMYDGGGYDRGKCITCQGKGCPEESNYRKESINPDIDYLLNLVEAQESVVSACQECDGYECPESLYKALKKFNEVTK